MTVLHGLATLFAVLLSAALLGVEVWVVAIVALGWMVTRPVLRPAAVGATLLVIAVSAAAYVVAVVGLVVLVTP